MGPVNQIPRAPKNRAERRRKVRARFYKDKDDMVGTPFTSKGVRHPLGKDVPTSSDHTPTHNPKESNHARVLRQRANWRKAIGRV